MGLLDKLLNKLVDTDGMNAVPRDEYGNVNRRKIPAEKIERMQQLEASEGYRKQIYKMYYQDYLEKPFISQDRELNADWIELAQMFPEQCILQENMMRRYSDGLLPGHVYMLYWLNKYDNRRIPAYFEYDYGVHFVKEKEYLKENGYLSDDDKPTDLGKQAIQVHHEVIDKRHPKPLNTGKHPIGLTTPDNSGRSISDDITPGIINIPDSDMIIIQKEFDIINSLISKAVKATRLTASLKIDFSLLRFGADYTYYEYTPHTPTGRASKYPLVLHYSYDNHNQPVPQIDYFGELKYLKNGNIGAARLIFWDNSDGHMINIRTVKDTLVVKKVEKNNDSGWETIYKLET